MAWTGRRPTRVRSAIAVSGDVDWNREWQRVWKPHPGNAWFHYQADVYAAWLEAAGEEPAALVLKTDAFDEACGFDPLGSARGAHADIVHVDLSSRIARQAARHADVVPHPCVSDVRRLAFRSGTFDLVFSPSSLDHFMHARDIAVALRELRRVLRRGGRLLVTLDNPLNPLLELRRLVSRLTGPLGGLVPYAAGRTLSRRALVVALEEAGFEVRRSGTLLHVPRVLGLWIAEWAARRGRGGAAQALRATFARVERVAATLPTRGVTGHFVVADGRSLGPGPAATAAPAPARGVMAAVRWYHAIQHRARCAYLRLVPSRVVTQLDPALSGLAALVRRAAAVPLYLRQPVSLLTGSADGEPARVLFVGRVAAAQDLWAVLFDEPPAMEERGTWTLSAALDPPALDVAVADLLVADTTPALAPAFSRRGCLILPAWVRFMATPAALRATMARRSRSRRANLVRARAAGYRAVVWSYSRARSLLLYHRYLVPHAMARFEDQASPDDFRSIDCQFAAGSALAVFAPGAREPDALGIVVARGDVLWFARLGTRDGDPAIIHRGGVFALYEAAIALGAERYRLLDFGRCRPWRSDGPAWFKWKLGARPEPDRRETLERAIRILRPTAAIARRLHARGALIRTGGRIAPLAPDGAVSGFAGRAAGSTERGGRHGR